MLLGFRWNKSRRKLKFQNILNVTQSDLLGMTCEMITHTHTHTHTNALNSKFIFIPRLQIQQMDTLFHFSIGFFVNLNSLKSHSFHFKNLRHNYHVAKFSHFSGQFCKLS